MSSDGAASRRRGLRIFNAETCAAVFRAFAKGNAACQPSRHRQRRLRCRAEESSCTDRHPVFVACRLLRRTVKKPKIYDLGRTDDGAGSVGPGRSRRKGNIGTFVLSESFAEAPSTPPDASAAGDASHIARCAFMLNYIALFSSNGEFDKAEKIRRNELRRMRNVLLRMSCGSADSAAYQSSQG